MIVASAQSEKFDKTNVPAKERFRLRKPVPTFEKQNTRFTSPRRYISPPRRTRYIKSPRRSQGLLSPQRLITPTASPLSVPRFEDNHITKFCENLLTDSTSSFGSSGLHCENDPQFAPEQSRSAGPVSAPVSLLSKEFPKSPKSAILFPPVSLNGGDSPFSPFYQNNRF